MYLHRVHEYLVSDIRERVYQSTEVVLSLDVRNRPQHRFAKSSVFMGFDLGLAEIEIISEQATYSPDADGYYRFGYQGQVLLFTRRQVRTICSFYEGRQLAPVE